MEASLIKFEIMKMVTLSVEDKSWKALKELQVSLHQVNLIRQGKLPKEKASEFLNNL